MRKRLDVSNEKERGIIKYAVEKVGGSIIEETDIAIDAEYGEELEELENIIKYTNTFNGIEVFKDSNEEPLRLGDIAKFEYTIEECYIFNTYELEGIVAYSEEVAAFCVFVPERGKYFMIHNMRLGTLKRVDD